MLGPLLKKKLSFPLNVLNMQNEYLFWMWVGGIIMILEKSQLMHVNILRLVEHAIHQNVFR